MTRLFGPLAALLLAAAPSLSQTPQPLLATPSTVAWGFYSAQAKPVPHRPLLRHCRDADRLDLRTSRAPRTPGRPRRPDPAWLGPLYSGVPESECGPGGHILTGPVAIAEAEPGDVLEVRVLKIQLDTDFACNGFGAGRGFLPDDFPYGRSKIIPLDRKAYSLSTDTCLPELHC